MRETRGNVRERGVVKMKTGEIIKDGENLFSIFGILGSVVYVKRVSGVNVTPSYELEEVLKQYRKIEIIGKEIMRI